MDTEANSENIVVVLRCRPFSEKEKSAGHKKICQLDLSSGVVKLENPKTSSDIKTFTFDSVYDEKSKQIEVYNGTARRIVDAVLNGFNGTVFAYGQTGTGKTFSMQGVKEVPELRGIIPNAFNHIFNHITSSASADKKFLVRVSFLEIYNEEIKDLLIKPIGNGKIKGLEVKEHPEKGVYVKDLSAFVVKSIEEMENLTNIGNNARSVGATLMNENSSRSHSIFSITVECAETISGEEKYIAGKLHLVDLAGSERQSKTGASGDRLKEATKINLSLSALGNCISALVDGLLQDSLGGNAKTLMIATMSPANYNYEETLSTLRYANRAKNIKNKPKINEDPKDAMLREYQEEINRLKRQLEDRQKEGTIATITKIVKKITKVKKIKKKREIPIQRTIEKETETFQENQEETMNELEEEDDDEESDEEIQIRQSNPQVEKVKVEKNPNPLSDMDPETISRLQAEIEAEKRALLASKDIVVEEKQRIAGELEKRAAELESEKQARLALDEQLKELEAKLLIGGSNIEERINSQEKELQLTQAQLQEQQMRERELQRQLEARQEAQLQMEENYASLQDEVDSKSKKLKKLWTKLQSAKSEINDLQDEFRNEREDLLDTIREISRELSLKLTLIENFVPAEERTKIESRATYDEEHDDWQLAELTSINLHNKIKRPVSLPTLRRPMCQYSRSMLMMGDTNLRFRGENIITLQLDIPERTTFQSPSSNNSKHPVSNMQGALDYVMKDEDDDEILVTSDADIYGSNLGSMSGMSPKRKESASPNPSKSKNTREPEYPQSRNSSRTKTRFA
ncbi:Kinesin-like protein kif3b [Nowakowskiella sp. JEL0078]|nr:Kinesin-like protein kif3b [Nowakowskiella sp. JEL0078]